MNVEIRSGEVHICGYVNAVERDSRVLPASMAPEATSPFVEKVSAGAFQRAIQRNPDIGMMLNHKRSLNGTLKLKEDNIGLYADMYTSDPEVLSAAQKGELRGWSFGFYDAKSNWEPYKDGIQRRTLMDFGMDEVSLLTKATPAYFGTSVEVRGMEDKEHIVEIRSVEDMAEPVPKSNNYHEQQAYRKRMLEITKRKGELL